MPRSINVLLGARLAETLHYLQTGRVKEYAMAVSVRNANMRQVRVLVYGSKS